MWPCFRGSAHKTKKPLRVPLPAGKKLFLSPGRSGQITQTATARHAVVKLIEAVDAEISEEGAKRQDGGSSASSVSGVLRDGRSGAV